MVVFEINKVLFDTKKNVLLVCVYIHPYDSKFWTFSQDGFGIEILEQCLIDLHEKLDDFYIMICGDLNARTACENALMSEDLSPFDHHVDVDVPLFKRRSDDKGMSNFGKDLLNVCSTFDCVIANGLIDYRFDESLTYFSSNGGSLVDYFVLSSELCLDGCVSSLRVLSAIDSPHLPVCITINEHGHLEPKEKKDYSENKFHEKYVWDDSLEPCFLNALFDDSTQDLFARATNFIDVDINHALSLFTDALLASSKCMKKRFYSNDKKTDALWFDKECRNCRTKTRHALNLARRTKLSKHRAAFVIKRNQYKLLIRKKSLVSNAIKQNNLLLMVKTANHFGKMSDRYLAKGKLLLALI